MTLRINSANKKLQHFIVYFKFTSLHSMIIHKNFNNEIIQLAYKRGQMSCYVTNTFSYFI